MPVSPEMAEDLAREVRALYDAAEGALLEKLAEALADGIDSPRWVELKLAAIGSLRNSVDEIITALQTDTDGAVRRALVEAYGRGRQAAVAEMGGLDIGRELAARPVLPNAPAVDRLAASLVADTRPLYQRVSRVVVDAYRSITSRASATSLIGGLTRRQASQRAMDQLASAGITGFVDKAGRSWDMASYAEMAVRSVTARAAIEGHIDALAEIGVGLVIVSDAPLECPLCARWEGKTLTLGPESGPHTIQAEHAIQPSGLFARRQTVDVRVTGSLTEARASGLFHPNCRHSLAAYLPGVTTRPPDHPTPGTTYEDTQRQREIERHIRRWKRRAAAALDEPARRAANAKVRAWQKAAREHVAAHPDLTRKPAREQIPVSERPTADTTTADTPSTQPPADMEARSPLWSTDTSLSQTLGNALERANRILQRAHPGLRLSGRVRFEELSDDAPSGLRGSYIPDGWTRRRRTGPDSRLPLGAGGILRLRADRPADLVATIVHEAGHILDHQALGDDRMMGTDGLPEEPLDVWLRMAAAGEASTPTGPLVQWFAAVMNTRSVRELIAMRRRGDGHVLGVLDGREYTVSDKHLEYLLRVREIFARTYLQWMARETGDPRLRYAVEQLRDVPRLKDGTPLVPPEAWDDDDIEPVLDALTEVFRAHGMTRQEAQ
ncbi:phage minor capsid protein [Streptomyces jumonjinensis]|uniref:Phage capsid protein n=1 Tax=Streptomyces jumonjinensis TaxID=1945 RepID=A0A646KP72_STRJU|nr:phage minor capsid protein [Streptomyces jumonjinensis]MQT03868.1 hypothetical protein [Streptomyces jumonjinensis]